MTKQFQPNTSGVQIHSSDPMNSTVIASESKEMLSTLEGTASHVLSNWWKGLEVSPRLPRPGAQKTYPAIAERQPAEATSDAFVDLGDMSIG